MDLELSVYECRVIGCLLEKESTTPDQYPLTLNALLNACNQKSNREPVMALTTQELKETLAGLQEKRLVSEETGSRAAKYRHRFCNTEFSDLQFSEEERGVICVLLLRGAQTPGELRSRTARLSNFSDVKQVETVLQGLVAKELVVQMPREAGKRESRFAHLFSGPVEFSEPVTAAAGDKQRIQELEHEVLVLKEEVKRLTAELLKYQGS